MLTAHGNFANSYRQYNGDATAMVEVYIDKTTKKLVGSSIIPMWVRSALNSNYTPIPLKSIVTDESLKNKISTYELEKVEEICKFITKTMIATELKLDSISEKLYFMKDGYKREKVDKIQIDKNSKIVKEISKSKSVCFIGDSITEGTKNGGYGWYEPLINIFENIDVSNVSKGSATVKTIIEEYKNAPKTAELYIIAIGTNDIRYRDKSICAMDEETYIKSIESLIDNIPNSKVARFAFIAPWFSTTDDTVLCKVPVDEKEEIFERYSDRLEQYCLEKGYTYINPNEIIFSVLDKERISKYLIDYIHPNVTCGIPLYSTAVMKASIEK
ncbi:MAG: SGNH/GDSL hydrolase family protein [Clostridia bacterium]|nr:SGNH/GDSL hydrolase family protein [Clostridia bacterium]